MSCLIISVLTHHISKNNTTLFSVHSYRKVSTNLREHTLPSLVLVSLPSLLFPYQASACREPGRGSVAKTGFCGCQRLNRQSILQPENNSCRCVALQSDLIQGVGAAVPGQEIFSPLRAVQHQAWTQREQCSVKDHNCTEHWGCHTNQSLYACRNGVS